MKYLAARTASAALLAFPYGALLVCERKHDGSARKPSRTFSNIQLKGLTRLSVLPFFGVAQLAVGHARVTYIKGILVSQIAFLRRPGSRTA
jgi:hypothetical protein